MQLEVPNHSLTSRYPYTEHSPTHSTQHTTHSNSQAKDGTAAGRDAATRHFDVPRAGAHPARLPRLPWPSSANCFLFPSCAVLRRVASPVLFPREDIIRQGRVAQQRSSEQRRTAAQRRVRVAQEMSWMRQHVCDACMYWQYSALVPCNGHRLADNPSVPALSKRCGHRQGQPDRNYGVELY